MDLDKMMDKHLTRAFDPNRTIPDDIISKLLAFLRSAPSSLNIQPWHFYVLSSAEAKQRLARSLGELFEAGNSPKVLTASHAVILTSRSDVPDSHVEDIWAKEQADGRFEDDRYRAMWQSMVRGFLGLRNHTLKDTAHWLEKQTYLALGLTMMAAAELGVDATPLEGFDPGSVDAEFNIREDGYTATVLLVLGYPDEGQINTAPISRFDDEKLFTFV